MLRTALSPFVLRRFLCTASATFREMPVVSIDELKRKLATNPAGFKLIDVRTQPEVAATGLIHETAVNVPRML
jgi:hypothetical protein